MNVQTVLQIDHESSTSLQLYAKLDKRLHCPWAQDPIILSYTRLNPYAHLGGGDSSTARQYRRASFQAGPQHQNSGLLGDPYQN